MRRSWAAVAAAAVLLCSCGGEQASSPPSSPTGLPPPPVPLPPPAPSPAPPPASTQAALREIDTILKGLPLATVAFNTPENLRLGESKVIELLLSTRDPIAKLKQKVTEAGERVGAVIRISDRMDARLTGQGFKIHAVTPERQLISGGEVTPWKWDVEPTRTGSHRLHLTLNAILDVRGASSERTIRTFERTLTIDVSLSDRMATFVQENWQWLLTAILFPLGALYLNRRKKNARGRPAT